MMTLIERPDSYLRSLAKTIHTSWVEELALLQSITEPSARRLQIDGLAELHSDAAQLLQRHSGVASSEATPRDVLDAFDVIRLQHIVNRSMPEHVALTRSAATIVSVF